MRYNGFELSGQGSVHRRQSQHSHNTTSLVNRGASPVASSETLGSVQDLPLVRKAADRGSLPAESPGMSWLSAITLCADSSGVRKGGWRLTANNCGGLVDQLVVFEGLYHE